MAVATEINKKLKYKEKEYLVGSIAPDVAKYIGMEKWQTHFQEKDKDPWPNMKEFEKKYNKYLKDPFTMGYYIHLYTDYFWFKYFISEIKQDWVEDMEEKGRKYTPEEINSLIYSDYTNLNIQVIDRYKLPLDIFYEKRKLNIPKYIDEYPYDKTDVIIKEVGKIVENSTCDKKILFNMNDINAFVKTASELIYSEIEKFKIKEQ